MGAYISRRNDSTDGEEANNSFIYRYPTKNGDNYFASHFIMGGERFDASYPDAYLFGENSDLNFLGSRPMPFPYPAPQPNEPTRPLRCLINIRKESLRFVRAKDKDTISDDSAKTPQTPSTKYNIEFVFDTECRCAITVHYFCTEEITPQGIAYSPRFPTMSSETYHYKRGCNQVFQQSSHVFDPSKYSDSELTYNNYSVLAEYLAERGLVPDCGSEVFPVVIQCVAEEGDEPRQSHVLLAVVERASAALGSTVDNVSYTLKPLKQKLFVDGLVYLLQEIYGIENKNIISHDSDSGSAGVDDGSDGEEGGCECVICMSEARDTLILPCKHLCLCSACADSLRYQANNCPICRAPFRALLQIRAVRKMLLSSHPSAQISELQQVGQDVPAGYESIPLIEALNGPTNPNNHVVVNENGTGKKSKHKSKSNSSRHDSNLQAPHGNETKTSPKRNLKSSSHDPNNENRAGSAPPPSRHRNRHKGQGAGKNKTSRPHPSTLPMSHSLTDTSPSPESKSLLDSSRNAEDSRTQGDAGSSDNDIDDEPTIITVDQATDTSLDHREPSQCGSKEEIREADVLFHRRKNFNGEGDTPDDTKQVSIELQEKTNSMKKRNPSLSSTQASSPSTPDSSARSSADSFTSVGSSTRLLVASDKAQCKCTPSVTVVTIQGNNEAVKECGCSQSKNCSCEPLQMTEEV